MSTERPGVLTAIAILGIILGSLGVLAALMGIAGAFVQQQLPADFPGGGQELEFAAQMQEITRAYLVPTVIGALANLVVSALLIVGGAMLLNRKPSAVGLMTGTVVAAIVVDIYSTALAAFLQVKMMPVTEELARAVAADLPSGSDAAMDSFMSIAVWTGTVFSVFWLLCKLAYYIVALVALKRPAVKGWIAEGAVA